MQQQDEDLFVDYNWALFVRDAPLKEWLLYLKNVGNVKKIGPPPSLKDFPTDAIRGQIKFWD